MCRKLWVNLPPGVPLEDRDLLILEQKKKSITKMIVIMVAFGLLWLPWHIFHTMRILLPASWIKMLIGRKSFLVVQWLAMSNSSCNPFIYALLSVS